jgi:tetratricopeptide (TPR) repeat protein
MGGQKKHAFKHNNEVTEDRPEGYNEKSPIATTLFISIDMIGIEDPLAVDCLYLAACVDLKDVPFDFVRAYSPRMDDAVQVLSNYKLVTRRPAESAFDLHRLVHCALREWLQRQEQLGRWTQHAIKQRLHVFPDDGHGNRSKWRRLLQHVKYALSYGCAERENVDRLHLVWKYAMTLYSDGRYDEAEELFVQRMETSKKKLGADHLDTLAGMGNLASTYWNQGRWEDAEKLQVQVMETRKTKLGADHPDALTNMSNLAFTWKAQGRNAEATVLMRHCVQQRQRVLKAGHPNLESSLTVLEQWEAE